MQNITIHRSRKGLAIACGVHLLSAISTVFLGLPAWQMWLAQCIFATLIWSSYFATIGLGRRGISLQFDQDWYLVERDLPRQRLRGIVAGVVHPGILSMQLSGEKRDFLLVLLSDAVDPQAHWQLRRLALSGLPVSRRTQ